MIKAVVYDLDDTIVNSELIHFKAWNVAVKEINNSITSIPKKLQNKMIGRKGRDNAKEIVNHFQLPVDSEILINKKINITHGLIQDELVLLEGARESLELLKKNNLKIALATNAVKRYVDAVLDKFSLRGFFDVIVTGDDTTFGKPNPEVFLKAVELLDVKPVECIVFEDSTTGIQAAKAAGCICIAVRSPNILDQDYTKADLIIDSLEDVSVELIDKFNLH